VTAARGTDPKVVVVDDHELFRRGLIGLLEERGIELTDDFREGIAAFLEKRTPIWPSRC